MRVAIVGVARRVAARFIRVDNVYIAPRAGLGGKELGAKAREQRPKTGQPKNITPSFN